MVSFARALTVSHVRQRVSLVSVPSNKLCTNVAWLWPWVELVLLLTVDGAASEIIDLETVRGVMSSGIVTGERGF